MCVSGLPPGFIVEGSIGCQLPSFIGFSQLSSSRSDTVGSEASRGARHPVEVSVGGTFISKITLDPREAQPWWRMHGIPKPQPGTGVRRRVPP